MSDKEYKKKCDVMKNIKQCFLVFIEVGLICFLFIIVTNKIVPCKSIIDYIERGTYGIAIYEFVIFITLKFINDAKLDEYNAIRTTYKHAILAVNNNSDGLMQDVINRVSKQLDHGIMNSVAIRKEYKLLLDAMNQKDIVTLEYRLIEIEHCIATEKLSWNYTLLLRRFK